MSDRTMAETERDERSWNLLAARFASAVNKCGFHLHRGTDLDVVGTTDRQGNTWDAPAQPNGTFFLFANASYDKTDFGQKEVEAVKSALWSSSFTALGFGLSRDNYSWAMIVRPPDGLSLPNARTAARDFWMEEVHALAKQGERPIGQFHNIGGPSTFMPTA